MADLSYTYMSKANGRRSEIDHIYWSSVINQRVKTYLGESAVSDHYSVIISIDIEKRSKRKIGKEVKFVRSYKHFSQEKFNYDLLNCNWELLGLTYDVNEMVNLAQSFIKETFEFNVPLCKIKFNDKHISELQQETKELMKKRNKERRLGNVEEYKKLRNKCNKLIKKDRCESINTKITNDPKKGLWRQYNKIVNGRESKQMQLKENGMIIEDNTKISNIMNVFFKEKIVNIKSELPVSNLNPLARLKNHIGNKKLAFSIRPISLQEAKMAIKNLNPKVSSGVSGIPKKLIRNAHDVLALPMQRIFNTSIQSCSFPDAFKRLSSIPVHKKLSKDNKEHYRQIVSIEALSSVIEGEVNRQLLEFIIDNEIIPPQQFAFIKGKNVGTISCLNDAISKWLLNIDNKKYTVVTSFDLKSAFPTLDTNLVLEKMRIYGVSNDTIKWFKTYLDYRIISTRLVDAISDEIRTENQLSERSQLSST